MQKNQQNNWYINTKSTLGCKYIQLSMEDIAMSYFTNSFNPGSNENPEFYSYIINDHEQYACDSHTHMFHPLNLF